MSPANASIAGARSKTPGAFTQATAAAHSVTVVAEYIVLRTGVPVGKITTVLPGAYVLMDTTATTLRTLSFSCLDPLHLLAPTSTTTGILDPNSGVELQVRMGFQVGDTAPVLWTQGVFLVAATETSTSAATVDSGGGTFPGPGPNLTVTGYDRSKRISLNLFESVFHIAAGTLVGTAIEQILAAQASWCTGTAISPSTVTVAAQVFNVGTDPWQKIVTLAAAAGMVAYFDAQGILVVRAAPSQAGAPTALSLVDGASQTAISMTLNVSATPGYNGVVVIGSSAASTQGYVGSAFTMNPNSKLYATGPYGRRPAPPVTLATATSNGQCEQVAQAILSQYLGLSRSIIADMMPAPFLDAYDLIFALNKTTNVNDVYILQQSTRYLDYSQQEAITAVPLGSPISQLTFLQTPSVAVFGSANQLFVGTGTWTPSTGWTFRTTPNWTPTTKKWKTGWTPNPTTPTWTAATGKWKTTGKTWSTAFGSGGGSGSYGAGALGLGGFGGLGLLGFGGGWGLLWGGGGTWRRLFGGWGSSSAETVATEAEAAAADL